MTKYKIINGEPIEIIPDPDQTPGIMDTLQPGAIPEAPEVPEPPEPIEPIEPEKDNPLLEALEDDVKKIIISEGLREEKEIDEMLEEREEEGEEEEEGGRDENSPDSPEKPPKPRRRKRQG